MAAALVDSNVLIAFASARDRDHEAGTAIVGGFDHGELPDGQVIEYVLAETLNFVHERLGHATAVDLHTRLKRSDGFDLVRVANADYSGSEAKAHPFTGVDEADNWKPFHVRSHGWGWMLA